MIEERHTEDLLIHLRDRLSPGDAPVPSEQLRSAFTDGLGGTEPLPAPAPSSPRRRRTVAVVGAAAVLALGGTGVAGALPGPAQSAFDRGADAVGLDLRPDTTATPPADPATVEVEDPAGRTFADPQGDDGVVGDATDPDSPGIDTPADTADDAQDLGSETPAPQDTPADPVVGDTPADQTETPTGPTTGGPSDEPPVDGTAPPTDPVSPDRPSGGGGSDAPPTGGQP